MKFIPEPRRAPAVSLSTVGARRGLFLRYLYSAPRAPPRWGSGGFFVFYLFIPVLGLLLFTFYKRESPISPMHALRRVGVMRVRCILLFARRCSTFFSHLRNLPMGWALPDTPEGALPRITAVAAGRC